jgi:predicted metalloprotease
MLRRVRTGVSRPFVALGAALLALVTSCSTAQRSPDAPNRQADVAPTAPMSGEGVGDPTYPVLGDVVDFGEGKPPQVYDGYLTAALTDIESFWANGFEAVYGEPWTPLDGGVYAAWPARDEPIPGCGNEVSTYDEVATSGAFYCRAGDFIAYDDHELLPGMVKGLGAQAVAIVLAHEFGHAVQARTGDFDEPVILKEQQADCFAGAWAAHVAHSADSSISFDDSDIRTALIAMIQIRDPVEAGGLANPEAHGTGFDRVGAFQDGFIGGIARCATFFTENRMDQLIDVPFLSPFDDPNGGDLPLIDPAAAGDDIVTLIPASLDLYWVPLLTRSGFEFTPPTLIGFSLNEVPPGCTGLRRTDIARAAVWCPATNVIHLDMHESERLLSDRLSGDLSVAYLIASAYSEAVQTTVGTGLSGALRSLRNDCFSGAWVGANVPPTGADSIVELSAGDLDEAVVTLISHSDPTDDTDVEGAAFEKVEAFRTGVLGGLDACLGS